jgi:tetratricopeptide (TPR) repeat protein
MQAFDKLDRAIRSIHPTETDEILPFVATLMGMKMRGRHEERVRGIRGEALEKLILKNFRDLIAKSSELSPMVIVMEDLHWADNSSLELLQSLYGLTEKNRLLFINVFRPGYLEDDGSKAAVLAHERIEIQPLANLDSEALINNMLEIKGLPFSLREQIVGRAGGNPFFIEEVVRSLIDEGAVLRGVEGFEVSDRIDQVVIPPTINEVLMARLDRLEEQTRELVKVAAVIGRSFFDRIIKDVADSIAGVDHRLSYLKDMQLIRERKRLQELEYLFSHALAQEAAYESTLLKQRKALHLKVAQSIEKVFKERLHEFYGMLAHHYGLAEDGEKTEEYLIKAGEEALNSSASSEALNYLQKALRLYMDKYGNNADPAKLAVLEKNIALAYHNKTRYKEALEYFDTAMERYGMPLPKYRPGGIVKALWGFVMLFKTCYFKPPGSRKIPTSKENEAFETYLRAGEAFMLSDPQRFFLGALNLFRHTARLDPKTTRIAIYWSTVSAGLVASGRAPFWICRRLLEISKRYLDEQDIRGNLIILTAEIFRSQAHGEWEAIDELDQDLLNASLRIGEFFWASVCWRRYGLMKSEQGEFAIAKKVQNKLHEIGKIYDHSYAIIGELELKTSFLLTLLSVQEAIQVADEGISYAREMDNIYFEIVLLGHKAEAQQLAGDTKGACDSLSQASELDKKLQVIPRYYYAPYSAARLSVDVEQIKQAIRLDSSEDVAQLRKNAYKTGKAALRNARNWAPYRTKIFRLMGDYNWLHGRQRKALKWWDKSIREGECLGARPDLSRTYFEVGKHLMEPKSKYKELNGIDARAYLEKARVLFVEMELQKDLDNLYTIIPQALEVGF